MERKQYLRNLLIGVLGGAIIGGLLALAYRKWGKGWAEQSQTRDAKPKQPIRLAPGNAIQVAMLGLQLIGELIRILRPEGEAPQLPASAAE